MSHSLPDVFCRHPELPCLTHPAVRSALGTVRSTIEASGPHPNLTELLGICETRLKHLAGIPGKHAAQLHQSVQGLCTALERQPPGCQVGLTSVCFDNGLVVHVWERFDTCEALACLVSYDRRILTDSEWHRVWSAG